MREKYRNYTDADIIRYSQQVKTFAELLKKLNLKPAGGNYINMRKHLQRLKINTSHWTGQAWSKDLRKRDWSTYKRIEYIKKHLIREFDGTCQNCKESKWLGKNIPLEVHHKDGDRTNNVINNLQLLCCNCHALTDNWRGRTE